MYSLMNTLVNDIFNELQPVLSSASMFIDYASETMDSSKMPIDILKKSNGLEILADMPGYQMENISIKIANNVLTISGTRPAPVNVSYLKQERVLDAVTRNIKLSAYMDASVNSCVAKYNNGVLHVSINSNEADPVVHVQITK